MTTFSNINPKPERSFSFLIFLKSSLSKNLLPPTPFSKEEKKGVQSKIQNWLDSIEIQDVRVAKLICHLITPSCPFARDFKVFGRSLFRIPPLCHFNPFYNELMSLRFRALVFLSEQETAFSVNS